MSTSTSTQFLTRKQENIKEEDKTDINREQHGKQANIWQKKTVDIAYFPIYDNLNDLSLESIDCQ